MKKLSKKLSTLLIPFLLGSTAATSFAQKADKEAQLAQYAAWRLYHTEWLPEHEAGYSAFVRAIGKSGCKTVDGCIRNEANPYRQSDPPKELYTFWSDCADWPYFLRAYYAWKNGLPFAFSTSMMALPLTEEQQATIDSGEAKAQNDVRYSWNGNMPRDRKRLPIDSVHATNFFAMHSLIQNSVHTATFRVDPTNSFGDMYTPAVGRGAIRPGTAVYDPTGHVGVVYDVTADGQIMVFDAYMDRKSVSERRAYSSDYYKRSKKAHGGWFQNFRPVVIEDAIYHRKSKSFVGGTMRLLKNKEIADYSLEMFGTTKTEDGATAYEFKGKITNSFQEFLRKRMFKGEYKLDVLNEFKLRIDTLCNEFKQRVISVQDATTKGIAFQPHAPKLPDTIYGGDGDWDLYSTPGGDVRRRVAIRLIADYAKELSGLVAAKSPDYSYAGGNLKSDLITIADDAMNTCSITYKNSASEPVTLTLGTLMKRAHRMSFSPWQCIELRWGANNQEELKTCQDLTDTNKMRWYNAEQTLRNLMVRDTNIFTGFTLEELEQNQSIGPAQAENLNLLELLESEL